MMPAIMQMLPHALLCFSLLLFLPSPCTSLSEDGKLLLHIRDTYWIDEYNATGNWDPSRENPCSWNGIYCNRFNAVTALNRRWAGIAGNLTSAICGLSSLTELILLGNDFDGPFPDELLECKNLQKLDLSSNLFAGSLPDRIFQLKELKLLYLGNNGFYGQNPYSFGNLTQLEVLDMSDNSLSGKIPSIFSNLRQLEVLDLRNNKLNGEIPATLGNVSSLQIIDLSNNLLSGHIPDGFRNLHWFNLSNNRLWGSIPSCLDYCSQKDRFLGNPDLRGGCLSWHLVIKIVVPSFLLAIVAFFSYFRNLYLFKLFSISLSYFKSLCLVKSSGMRPLWKLKKFHSLELDESYILRNLTTANLIGSGGGGNVYKVTLQNQKAVAVKKVQNIVRTAKLNRHTHQENNGVDVEVDTLGLIRHVNILSLLCYISSEEADFKLLVYEYMSNGSLFDRLHHVREPEMALPWPARYKIAVGAARALSYMHHDCFPPILHRDVKSSNILLDADLEAKIGDFGQSSLLQNLGAEYWVSGYVGSHGYIAPVCGKTESEREE